MRPRVFPAENEQWRVMSELETDGFNEAAGIPRGKQTRIQP